MSVGLDMGLKSLVTTSDGETYDNNRYTKKYEQKLAAAQKHLSRKQKDSNGWEEQRMTVAKIHETLAGACEARSPRIFSSWVVHIIGA